MTRWALVQYDPEGREFHRQEYRTQRRAVRMLAYLHLNGSSLVVPGDGYLLRLEKVTGR